MLRPATPAAAEGTPTTVNRSTPEQFQLRLPSGLRARIKAHAERHGRSTNAEIIRALEGAFPAQRPADRKILEAYREWLHFEAQLLGVELYPSLPPANAARWVPQGTLAAGFHFPESGADGRTWRDVPKPSTRAETVLRAVGVLP